MTLVDRDRSAQPERQPEWQPDPWDAVAEVEVDVVEVVRGRRSPLKWFMFAVAVLAVIAVLVAGSVGWWYIHQINPGDAAAEPVTFIVEPDDTLQTLSVRLREQGFIVNDGVFRWYVQRQGGLELSPGYFVLRPHDHIGDIVETLATPPEQTYTSVTFPEGFTVAKMANRLAERVPRLLVSDVIAAASNGSVRSQWQPEGGTNLEGLLFPDTYQVSNGESAEQVVTRMATMMERVGRQEDIVTRGYAEGRSAYEVLIIASLIEREAKVEADRPLIARVILNRLTLGMPLQIDATLYYDQDPSLSFEQLKSIDSPYNTYLHTGLPPTPIANPGRASIHAAVNPAANPPAGGALCKGLAKADCLYLYYVLADADGAHAFAVTLEQHQANIDKAIAAGLL